MLAATDPVTWSPRRVAVAGGSGAGKTTFARRVAEILGVPHTEIDALFHGPEWEPRATFEGDVAAVLAGDGWVVEWQYPTVREAIAERADTLVWLDLPYGIVFGRLLRRTVRRSLSREPLWNGNVEPSLLTLFTDPDHILRWAVRTRNHLRGSVPALERSRPTLHIVRLRSSRQVETWMRGLVAASSRTRPPTAERR